MRRLFAIVPVILLSMHVAYAAPLVKPTVAVNINQADQKQLITLKGIGKKRAAAIIAYRQAHGKFHTMDNLLAVPGMNKKLLEKIDQQNTSRVVFN